MTHTAAVSPPDAAQPRRWPAKVLRYLGGSVVATVCSEGAFVLLYGPLGASPAWSSVIGWLAGALPNYWLNRQWVWGRSGRPSLRSEVLPYVTIVLVTLVTAMGMTALADHVVRGLDVAEPVRVTLVALVFLGVYGVMFVLRFLLFDRLFERLESAEERGGRRG